MPFSANLMLTQMGVIGGQAIVPMRHLFGIANRPHCDRAKRPYSG